MPWLLRKNKQLFRRYSPVSELLLLSNCGFLSHLYVLRQNLDCNLSPIQYHKTVDKTLQKKYTKSSCPVDFLSRVVRFPKIDGRSCPCLVDVCQSLLSSCRANRTIAGSDSIVRVLTIKPKINPPVKNTAAKEIIDGSHSIKLMGCASVLKNLIYCSS